MKEYNIAEYMTDGDRNSYDFFEFEQVILTNVLSFDKIVGHFSSSNGFCEMSEMIWRFDDEWDCSRIIVKVNGENTCRRLNGSEKIK